MGTDEATLAKMIQKRKLLVDLNAEDVMNMTADKATAEIAKMRAKAVAAGKKEEVKKIDDLIKESDTRTPAEQSADSLLSIKKDIAFIGSRRKNRKEYYNKRQRRLKDINTEAVTGAQFTKDLQHFS